MKAGDLVMFKEMAQLTGRMRSKLQSKRPDSRKGLVIRCYDLKDNTCVMVDLMMEDGEIVRQISSLKLEVLSEAISVSD